MKMMKAIQVAAKGEPMVLVEVPVPQPYQGTNFDRKTAFHFGGLFFYLWPEMLEIAPFSGSFSFLRSMTVVSKTGFLFAKSLDTAAVNFDLNTFLPSACPTIIR